MAQFVEFLKYYYYCYYYYYINNNNTNSVQLIYSCAWQQPKKASYSQAQKQQYKKNK
jgi:hypothetical protein